MRSPILLTASIILCGKMAVAKAPQPIEANGKIIYENNCIKCHGKDGTLGKFGAKNLHISKLSSEEAFRVISEGKWFMPRWKKKLSAEQIFAVAAYIRTLR